MKTPMTDEAAEQCLFEALPAPTQADLERAQARADQRAGAAPRVLEPNRQQVELRSCDLESLLPQDHRARLVWGYVERQDLSRLYEAIKARGSFPGRRAIDPRILFALWLYATLDGVGSGREVARLRREHDAYRWICGGVEVNYHALNDFRGANDALMDELLGNNVAALAAAGAIELERVAQDGMRVRAAAGAGSFRREPRLQEHLGDARELVQTLKTEAQADPCASQRRAQAAQLRAAREREQRIQDALAQLPEVAASKLRKGGKAEDARASTTDADARVMKMGDGAFARPTTSSSPPMFTARSLSVWAWSKQAATWRRWPHGRTSRAACGPSAQAVAGRWRLSCARADRCGSRQDRGLCARAQA